MVRLVVNAESKIYIIVLNYYKKKVLKNIAIHNNIYFMHNLMHTKLQKNYT